MAFEQYIDAADKHARKDRSGSAHDHVVRVAELACRMSAEHATREARAAIDAAEAHARAAEQRAEDLTRELAASRAELEALRHEPPSHGEPVPQGDDGWAELPETDKHAVVKSTPPPGIAVGPAGEICLMYGAGKLSGLTVSCVRGEWESIYSGQVFERRAMRFCLDAAEGSYPLREDLAAALAAWSGSLVSRGYVVKRDGLWRWVEESPPGITKGED